MAVIWDAAESAHDGAMHADSITVTGSVGRAARAACLLADTALHGDTGQRKRKIDSPKEWVNGLVDRNGGRAAALLGADCSRCDSCESESDMLRV